MGPPPPDHWCRPDKAGCDPTNHEGFPLIKQGDTRSAVGYAQCILNRMLLEMTLCMAVPSCRSGFSAADLRFLRRHLGLVTWPMAVDCVFGSSTRDATLALQAYWFKDPAARDGKIGSETWRGLKQI